MEIINIMGRNDLVVVGLGVATMDYLIGASKFLQEDTKGEFDSFKKSGGGNCANTLTALKRLGVKEIRFITALGGDKTGDEIVEDLQKEGVDSKYVNRIGEDSSSSHIIVAREKSTRTVYHKRGVSYEQEIKFPDSVLDSANWLHLDGRFGKSALRVAEMANGRKIPLSVECERTGLGVEELFKYAKIVVTSRKYHQQKFENENFKDNLQSIVEQGPEIAITTLGKEGAVLRTKRDFIKVETYPVEVVDTTGAGDAFIGGYIFGHLNGFDYEKSMKFACWVAGKKCEKQGAREGLPYGGEGEIFIKSLG